MGTARPRSDRGGRRRNVVLLLLLLLAVAAAAAVVGPNGEEDGARRAGDPESANPSGTVGSSPSSPPAETESAEARPRCTVHVSPDADEAGDGLRADEPTTLRRAAARTDPGDVVCLHEGEYVLSAPLYIERSGEEGRPIVYRSYDGRARLRWRGDLEDDMIQVTADTHHIDVTDLDFDGNDVAVAAVKCQRRAHHVRVLRNRVRDIGVAAIIGKYCDYLTVDRNLIHRTGYGYGWGSGISLNDHVWHDREPGFHSFVTNNVISGSVDESDYHSDGNGIIVDLGGDTPPVLIANNIVHQNGGRCIHSFHVQRVWIVNNTCYKNTLDTRLAGDGGGVGEFTAYDAQDVHMVNNVAVAWNASQYPFKAEEGSTVSFARNVEHGGQASLVPTDVYDDADQLRRVDPRFVDPPSVDDEEEGQYRDAAEPDPAGRAFRAGPGSPLIDAGVDPRTLDGMTPELLVGFEAHAAKAFDGTRRPVGAGWDIGAHEQ